MANLLVDGKVVMLGRFEAVVMAEEMELNKVLTTAEQKV